MPQNKGIKISMSKSTLSIISESIKTIFNKPFFFIFLNLFIINLAVIGVMNLRYPLIGHDFTYALPSLLDNAIHFRQNGFSIQWFTPTFGGGIPSFANPNNIQFSLPALLILIMPPWSAIITYTIIYITIGFLACYYFLYKTLNMHWTSSVLGALFFSINGFCISRITPGEVPFLSLALFGLYLIPLFDKKMPNIISIPMLGSMIGIFIYSAAYYILVIFAISILITAALIYLLFPMVIEWKKTIQTAVLGGALGLVISLSKLAAIGAFMRQFPRLAADELPTTFLNGSLALVLEILGVMSMVPIYILGGLDPHTFPTLTRQFSNSHYGLWELDSSLTPVVFAILLIQLIDIVKYRTYLRKTTTSQKIGILCFLFFTWVGVEFVTAQGFIYPNIRHLPILSSLRANMRFAGIFIFPLAFLSASIYNRWRKQWNKRKQINTFIFVNLLALLPLGFYFSFKEDMYWQFYDIAGANKIYTEINNGKSFEVTSIGVVDGKNTGAMLYRTSNLNVYEPIFGFKLENFHHRLVSGSIWQKTDGYYNMTNPMGFLYPTGNNYKAFDRFELKDKEKMGLFAKHIQPEWEIPLYQKAINYISAFATIGAITSLLFGSIFFSLRRANRNKI